MTALVISWQLTELNTFFLKHIFEMPPGHPLNTYRIALLGFIVAPSVRQYYTYITDVRCKRVGTQCWLFLAVMLLETLVSIKFGLRIFAQTQLWNILCWLFIQVLTRGVLSTFHAASDVYVSPFLSFSVCPQHPLHLRLRPLVPVEAPK